MVTSSFACAVVHTLKIGKCNIGVPLPVSSVVQAACTVHDVFITPIKIGLLESWRLVSLSYSDPLKHTQHLSQNYGNVVMQKVGKLEVVHLFGADANRFALLNPENTLSNKKAWDQIIGRLFPNGLMLRDSEDHRYHRRLMQAGFKSKAMRGYFSQMAPQIEQCITDWQPTLGDKQVLAYSKFKQTTLDLAATVFLGMDLGPDARKINEAFEATVAASMWRFPFAFPGTLLWRGIRARKTMCDFFQPLIEERKTGSGQDLLLSLRQMYLPSTKKYEKRVIGEEY